MTAAHDSRTASTLGGGRRGSRRRRPRDLVLVLAALLVAALLAGHRLVPDVGGLGTALDSMLPWVGLLVVPLGLAALLLRSALGGLALLVPVVVWAAMFGPTLPAHDGGTPQFRVATQNLAADNPDPAATVGELVHTGAALVAVQELNNDAAAAALDAAYPHQFRVGTVGLWSRYPITDGGPLDLGLGWNRALRATVTTPWGSLVVYVAHLASVRPGVDAERDYTIGRLADRVDADDAAHLLLLGDLNTATTDRQLDRLVPPLHDAERAGRGFGFTWPAAFPMSRPDQVLYRGIRATDAGVVHTTGSDHRAAVAGFRLD